MREQDDNARDVAEALPDSAVLHEGEIRVPQAKSRKTASRSEEGDYAEDEARRQAIVAVSRDIDAGGGCYSSTARSSNSASS